MDDEIRFIHSLKDIDKWIMDEDQGVSMMLTKIQRQEMDLRRKQLIAERDGTDEYEDDEFLDILEEHAKLTEKMEQRNAATHKHDIAFRPLRPNQQKQLEEDMQISIVRSDADSEYNKTDEELFGDKERRDILQRLSRIRNIYYDPLSYRAAILTIKEAIEYSLKHDYPWIKTIEETVQQFNEGKIKYLGNIPKLYLGFGTDQVTDPQILAGIVSGEITVVDKDEEDKELKRKRKERREYKPVQMKYDVVRSNEYQHYVRLHNQGYDTPISVILKSKSQLFDRLSMPFSFSITSQEKKNEPEVFDWLQPNAGEIFYCQQNNIPRNTTSKIISMINSENNNELNQNISSSMHDFIHAWSHPQTQLQTVEDVKPIQQSEQAMALEQNLLNSLRMNNPNL